ncbi:MAG: MFS transporter [Candidatus Azobacteroides sp.]|nr:MFS transporter [Candidatus Azobacteroides sp.]
MQQNINKNSALVVLCFASFLVPFMGSAINLALPQIGKTFSMSAVYLSWIATSYLITTAIFQVPFARLADIVGRRKIFIAGLSLFSLATFGCGFSPSEILLIAFRVFSGLGAAMMFGTNMAILTSIFPANERGKAIGINTSVVYLALAVGPYVGGTLTQHWGWPSLFYVAGLSGIVTVVCAFLFLRSEWVESKGEKFDYSGSFIYAIGLFSLIFGFSQLPVSSSFIWIAAGCAAFVLFVLYELKQEQPVFNVRIFSGNKLFGLSSLSALINYASTSGIAFMMSLYLYVRGYDAQHAGTILIVQACFQSVVSLVAGKLSDKFNPSLLATAGMGIILVGLCGFTFLSISTPVFFIIILLILLGIGFGLFSSPNANVIMGSVEKKYFGQASATMGTMRLTGQAFSMGIAMMALSLHVRDKVLTPELHPLFMKSLHVSFIIFAVLCGIGMYASSFRTKKVQE